jgi:uncharacterized protein DUF5615
MKILIDECMPWKIGRSLIGHECVSVVKAGFSGKKNGALLELAEHAGYDVLLTVDQGIPYQQQLTGRKIALIILQVAANKMEMLVPHISAVLLAIQSIKPGQVVHIGK